MPIEWRDSLNSFLIAYLLGISILPLLELIWRRCEVQRGRVCVPSRCPEFISSHIDTNFIITFAAAISAVSSKYNICDSHLLQFRSLSTDNCIIIKITDEVRNPIRSSSKYTENSANLPCLNNSGKMQLDKG
ncbi:hypothetical protein V8E54_013022 [Elaphomyces granulatus]